MTFRLATVVLASIVAAAQSNSINGPSSQDRMQNDTDEDFSPRIIGGRNALENEFPWTASLHYGDRYLCTSSLVTPSLIMTAAHCSNYEDGPEDPSKFYGYIGTLSKENSGTRLRFKKIIPHPKYGSGTGNDIALMKLESPVTLNSGIQTICLPTQNSNYDGTTAQVMGWGAMQRGSQQGANILQTATSPIANKMMCDYSYAATGIRLTNTHICAGGEVNKGICNGDSGGPLVSFVPAKPVAIGVAQMVSVYGCASLIADVFTATAMYTDWIKEAAGDEASNLCFLNK